MDDLHNAPSAPTEAIIVAGGTLHTRPSGRDRAMVIAADSGYDNAVALGLEVDLLVGDMDSISPSGLAHATAEGVTIERHPSDKDHTDLELAIRAAIRLGATTIEIHGADDGRIDHLLGVATLLTGDIAADTALSWHTRTGTVRAVSPTHPLTFTGTRGDTVSLIPVGTATDVTTTGLQWSLSGEDLPAGTTRGLSNILTSPRASVSVGAGHLLVVTGATP